MEARLIIALDDDCKIYKTLKVMDLQALDTYMSSHFENSDEVRTDPEFQPMIEEFLNAHKNYISRCSRQNHGYIRVVYTNEQGQLERIKAYYKKDRPKTVLRTTKAYIKRQSIKHLDLLRSIRNDFAYQMSPYSINEINYGLRYHYSTCYKNGIASWIEDVANQKNGYLEIRKLCRYVDKYLKSKGLVDETLTLKAGKVRKVDLKTLEEPLALVPDYPSLQCIKAVADPDELFAVLDLDDLKDLQPGDLPSYVKRKKN